MNQDLSKRSLTEAEAAKYLGVSRGSLRLCRMHGPRRNRMPCPPYIRLGRAIRYLVDDLDQWLEQHRDRTGG